MANAATTQLKVLVETPGVEKLPKLGNALRRLSIDTKSADLNTRKFAQTLKAWEATNVKSINNTRALANSWKELAASVQFGSNRFKQATAEAQRLDASLAKMQGKKMGGGGRLAAGAKIGGTIAASAVFGGPAGLIGSAIGGAIGGLPGAAAGGAYGAIVGGVASGIGETAVYSAALGRQRKALRLVIGSTKDYAKAQDFLRDRSKKLAIPQDVIVRQFTALTASVKGAGLSVEDAEQAFNAIASGIRGTGGSLEDMRAAMVATAQVFSKGKVSAEELRQQLGERLPGAFTLFAKSMNKTPAELDKALEQGKVTLDDFMNFTKTLIEEYGKNAEALAAGPEAAGDRLATAMSVLKDEVGKVLRPLGAQFQNWAASVVESIGSVIKFMNKLYGIGKENRLRNLERELSIWKNIQRVTEDVNNALKFDIRGFRRGLEGTQGYETTNAIVRSLEAQIAALKKEIEGSTDETKKLKDATDEMGKKGEAVWEGMKKGAQAYRDSIGTVMEEIADVTQSAFKKMEDNLVDFVKSGKFNFSDFANHVIDELIRMSIRQMMFNALAAGKSFFGFSDGGVVSGRTSSFDPTYGTGMPSNPAYRGAMANGGVFAQNGIQAFARGGIVSKPTLFKFANGTGLMGEAGPEAIMPLRRGPGGRLGVEANGGVGTTMNIAVDASGTGVEGKEIEGRMLGEAIGVAIQREIIKQRLPGGLLY